MKCEILTIGTELMLGLVSDSNAAYISRRLAEIGVVCAKKSSTADDIDAIVAAAKDALSASDVLIVTGGLGSTHDDLTREALAKLLSKKLVFQPRLAAAVEQKFKNIDKPMPSAALKQAYLPEGAEPIASRLGTAPGFIIKHRKKSVVVLPGVASEMRQMMEEAVLPFLKKELPRRQIILIRRVKTCGEGELAIEEQIKEIISKYDNPTISILPSIGEVELQIVAKGYPRKARELVESVQAELQDALGGLIYGFDQDTLEGVVGQLLKKHHLKLGVVESCTGGGLSDSITDVAGSSEYFSGAIVSYSNDMKRKLVRVASEDLLKHGAVSAPVALSMAEGGRHVIQADIALSVTGIAGPTGDTAQKPVGLVFIGLAWKEGSHCERFQFSGTRKEIKVKTSKAALNMLRLFLLEEFEDTGSEVS